ncbi:MAG TPA: hypothetical protein VIG48_01125 [Jatrophihabitans sp.]
MSTRSARIFAALTAAGIAVTAALSTATANAAAPPATTTKPAPAAAGWLAQQFTDHYVYPGGSSFDGGSTADSVFALAAAKAGASKIDAAMRYFAAHVDDYASVHDTSGKPGPYDGSVAKAAVAALVTGADPTHIGGYDLLQILKRDQCTSESHPKNSKDYTTPVCPAPGAARNIFSSVSESLAILAEARGARASGASYAPDAAAVTYLLSLQCANGGFTSLTTGGAHCAADPDATGFAVMALQAEGHQQAALARAVRWLRGVRNTDGSWTAQGVHNVDSTGLAAAALAGQRIDTRRSRSWLHSQQVTNGPTVGTGASRGALKYHGAFDASSSIKATADGVLGLVAHGDLATLTDRRASAGTAVLALPPAHVGRKEVPAGTEQTVTGAGFAAGELVVATLASHRVGSATTNHNGTATVTFTAPSSLPGKHTITLTGRTSALTTSAVMRVVPASNSVTTAPAALGSRAAAPNLASTGQDSRLTELEIVLGVALIGAGGVIALAGCRRAGHR